MKWIEYDFVCNAEKGINLHKKVEYNEKNLAIAQKEACNGEYDITEDEEVVVTKPMAIELGGTGASTAADAREKLGITPANIGAQAKHIATSVKLPVSGWYGNSQTVSVSGVTKDNTIFPAPTAGSHAEYYNEAGVFCSAQANNSLTFICEKIPAFDLTVNIVIFN